MCASKHYLFHSGSMPALRHYTRDIARIERTAPKDAVLSFRCFDAVDAKEVTLKIKTVGVTSRERFTVALNGKPLPGERIRRLHASDGRDARIHSIKLEPYSQFIFGLAPEMLCRGDNRLTVALAEQEPDVTDAIELLEMELLLRY